MDAATTGEVLKVPGIVASLNVIVVPTQSVEGPDIGNGKGYMFIGTNCVQPNGEVRMMVSSPEVIPSTSPVKESTVAIEVLVELHVPGSASDTTAVVPTHKLKVPVIGEGVG